MPTDNGIGYSNATADKQKGLRALLLHHMQVVRNVLQSNRYYHPRYVYMDMNAGDGVPREGQEGSPVIFLQVAAQSGMPYEAHFIEREPGNTQELVESVRFAPSECYTIHTADHNERLLRELQKYPPNKTLGLIYHDPNGVPNFDLLHRATLVQGRMDILIRIPANALKLNKRDLLKELSKIGKSEQIMRGPTEHDKWQWVFWFGTNYTDFEPWRSRGFHRINRREGREIFLKSWLTKDELESVRQSNLFGDDIEAQAFARADYACEICHSAKATQIHHKRYGPKITVDDLVAVCRDCHCLLEGKS